MYIFKSYAIISNQTIIVKSIYLIFHEMNEKEIFEGTWGKTAIIDIESASNAQENELSFQLDLKCICVTLYFCISIHFSNFYTYIKRV
jgi:hypothetical protein